MNRGKGAEKGKSGDIGAHGAKWDVKGENRRWRKSGRSGREWEGVYDY